MSRAALMADVQGFVGQEIKDCEDAIEAIAKRHHYTVLVYDPLFNTKSIMRDTTRLNVRTDKDSIVISFSIG